MCSSDLEALYRSAEAIFNLAQGGSYEEKQQVYAEAMDAYDEVPRRYPKSDYVDDSLYQKAWALINQERKEEALPLFEQIVSDHPDGRYGARSQFTLGDYYYGEKNYQMATASYEKFLELYPDDRLGSSDKRLRKQARELLGHLSEIEAFELYTEGDKL